MGISGALGISHLITGQQTVFVSPKPVVQCALDSSGSYTSWGSAGSHCQLWSTSADLGVGGPSSGPGHPLPRSSGFLSFAFAVVCLLQGH